MRPKLEACVEAIDERRQRGAHPRRARRALAAARAVHRRRRRHQDRGRAVSVARAAGRSSASASSRTYARLPVEFVRGEGARLWDAEGNEYLDFLCGISVTNLGHCHPRVVAAVREQAGRLMHVSNLFYTEPAMRLAERLSRVEPRRQGVPLQLRRRGDRGGDQARAQGAPGRRRSWSSTAPSTAAPTARCRRPRRRPSRRRSRRWCPASAPSRREPRGARARRSTSAPPRCCSSRSRARAACTCSRRSCSRRRARPATSTARR